ncbi:hypothetical protein TELCIR_02077 [Teladorsagia circumcincta]|uniref:Guanylate cyclase domain-containing protein n=1 Tax=Teladorsagia circumcincta TaxID=45464 RepID=A0A2G9V291_TELCI|nr:hypothetical protein TELCIR_02077 [Teladorsagia circumcincta]
MASRMESTGVANKIQISEQSHNLLKCFFQQFITAERGKIEVKYKDSKEMRPSLHRAIIAHLVDGERSAAEIAKRLHINERTKHEPKIHSIVIRPVAVHGAEC